MGCTYTMGYYSGVKNEIVKLLGKWIELETITLSEGTQTLKDKHCMFPIFFKKFIIYASYFLCAYFACIYVYTPHTCFMSRKIR